MNKLLYPIVFILALHTQLISQCNEPQAINYLHGNDVRAAFRNGGDMFWDGTQAQYQVPYNSGGAPLNTIFAGALWLTAVDPGGNVRSAIQTYRSNGSDYWSGPIDPSLGIPQHCQDFDQIWKVSGADVQALLADYNDNGTIDNPVPSSLLAWPAHGNPHSPVITNLSHVADLAPYFDRNMDQVYNPYDGDYPIADPNYPQVIADDLMWMVFNDNGGLHTQSNGSPLKAEIQLTAYAFSCSNDPVINSTIFTRHKIMSREALKLSDWHAGIWVDFDLGCNSDDYIGSAPNLNTIYAYNQSNNDVSCGSGGNGYGTNPPVQAVTMLNQTMDRSIYMINAPNSPMSEPSNAGGYQNIMKGYWKDGSAMTNNGDGYSPSNILTTPAPHIFPDNPNNATGWSMQTEGLSGNDLRALSIIDRDSIYPGESVELVTAYSYHRDMNNNNLQNVDLMYQQVPMIQNFFNNGYSNGTCSFATSVQQISAAKANDWIEVYPNPTKNILTINAKEKAITAIEIINPLGQSVLQKSNLNEPTLQLSLKDLNQGFYILKVSSDKDTWSQKIQITK